MSKEEKLREEIFLKEYSKFTIKPSGIQKNFTTLNEFINYVKRELEIWQNYTDGEPFRQINNLYSRINSLISQLNVAVEVQAIRDTFDSIKNTANSKYFFDSSTPESQFLIRLYRLSPSRAQMAYRVTFLNSFDDFRHQKDLHFAVIDSYEFTRIQNLPLEEKFSSERLDELAARYKQEMNRISEEHSKIKTKYEEQLSYYKDELEMFAKNYDRGINTVKKEFDESMTSWREKIKTLENTYDDLLKLSKPARYWDILRDIHEKSGKKWKNWAVGSTIAFICVLIFLLFTLPEWLHGDFKIDHIKGIIIFTLIVTVSTYLIHLFIKLSTSAFHLSRDAEERRQLTFLFLALMKEGKIEEKEREIVFQSLFSRADTGLLRSDGTPAIPGNVSEIFRNFVNR